MASNNPFAAPVIDPGLLSDPTDAFLMVQAVKKSIEFLQASAWDGFVLSPTPDLAGATTDELLEAYVRNQTSIVFHPVGTASMAPESSKNGVVTPSLLVKNVSGLRVVDASVFVSDFSSGIY